MLENLILVGAIAPGVVDRRSIEDVTPNDLEGFTQCHFFAGFGVWSHALRAAGWEDSRPVWTASCPCQPFSSAGKGAGFDDERHLWPAFHHLVTLCGPSVLFGEQVASKDGLAWLDLVQSDMEATDYAFGAVDLCAAGFGAPHIRQRTFWMAHALDGQGRERRDTDMLRGWPKDAEQAGMGSVLIRLDDDDDTRPQGHAGHDGATSGRQEPERPVAAPSVSGGLANDELQQRPSGASGSNGAGGWVEKPTEASGLCRHMWPGPTNGFWGDADWLGCRDGKRRPVEPGTFPLARGVANRVGTLRGYGNAIVSPVAQGFVEVAMEYLDDR